MALNKALRLAKSAVEWNGEQAAEVRGLTPADVVSILTTEGDSVLGMFEAFEKIDLKGIDTKDTAAVADRLLSEGPAFLMGLAAKAPMLLARLIAVASLEEGDDLDENSAFVHDNFSLPLQFECIRHVCIQTFAGPEGFRMFLGNVMALVGTVDALTSANPKQNERSSSDAG